MTAPPPDPDSVAVAASYPDPPPDAISGAPHPPPAPAPAPRLDRSQTGRLDGAEVGPVDVVLLAEQLTATKEWTVSGAVRFRRQIATYTRTVEVTVRREELHVEVRDVAERDGAWVGTEYGGPAVPAPPVVTGPGVFTLRQEVPEVTVRLVPYERVVVDIDRVTKHVQLTDTARREQAVISGDTGSPHPSRQSEPDAG